MAPDAKGMSQLALVRPYLALKWLHLAPVAQVTIGQSQLALGRPQMAPAIPKTAPAIIMHMHLKDSVTRFFSSFFYTKLITQGDP